MSAMPATSRQKSTTDRLREMILRGEIRPGEHMQEVPLSAMLGVSRTPVREALIVLGHEGLLIYRPNRGYVVREFALKDILDAYVVRANLEGLACRLLAENGVTGETRATLQECLDRGDEILAPGVLSDQDIEEWRAINDRLHLTILNATMNHTLLDVTGRTLSIPFLSSRVVHWFDFYQVKRSHQDHHVICESIFRGHGSRAEYAMREHIELGKEIIQAQYESNGGSRPQAGPGVPFPSGETSGADVGADGSGARG